MNKKDRDKIENIDLIIENNLGKKLNMPDNLYTYKPFSTYIEDSSYIFNSSYKIFTHIDVSCGTCLGDLELWNNLISEFSKYEVPVVLVCGSVDNFELFQYLCESGRDMIFPYPFFFDIKNEYVRRNEFMGEIFDFKTVLTDKENNILLLGNPARSKKIKQLYLDKIVLLQ